MKAVDVSVIMPCFNDGRYIQEAIESVDLIRNKETEIIIVDDGSTDSLTKSILSQLSDERIRIIHADHGGPSAARNLGIENARGSYILPLDADDRIEPEYIETALNILKNNPRVGVVYCHADLFGEETGMWKLPDYSFERMLIQSLVFVTAMFRKEDWSAIGGFRTDMKHGMEDYDFFIGMLAFGKEIYQLPEVLFHYRIKNSSRTTAFLKESSHVKEAFQQIYEHHQEFYQKNAKLYACLLRAELIQEQYEKQRLIQANQMILRIKRIAPINWLVKRVLRK
ncbi:MAG: glycosyltransferase family 2 protein [Clostridia bacterium]|nr:glycosyltransferase family 2 protein [Clostridia bacterium]